MRKKKVALNALAGFILQGLMTVYGLVFPRLVMSVYGSGVNGVLQSIAQFLGYISLLDAGVSAVIRAKFYKPLADEDYNRVQKIVNSAKNFYHKIAFIFIAYTAIVAAFLPLTFAGEYEYIFTFSLVIIIALSTFAEYFFGISYQVLLEADQRKYIVYFVQSVVVVLNTVLSIILINAGVSIHLVKIVTSFLFIARPLIISLYCRKRYHFTAANREIEIIENKWTGMGHHLAYFLHSHTDIVLLTFAKGPYIVSVYSVYNMIVTALRQILSYLTGGIEAAFGNMIAKNEKENLKTGLDLYELLIFSCSAIVFTTTAVTILDFVKIYTSGVNDINYIEPAAAILLILAEVMYCARRPYEALVMASGKLKETMKGAFVEAGINIIVSIILVWKYSIAGVALGTLLAMAFRTIQYSNYVSKNIVERKSSIFIFKFAIYLFAGILIYSLFKFAIIINPSTFFEWVIKAGAVFIVSTAMIGLIDFLLFKRHTCLLINMVIGVFAKKKDGQK